ncbi:MAG: hypothetical protein AAB641_01330 [Patescibacteria group bacterium]
MSKTFKISVVLILVILITVFSWAFFSRREGESVEETLSNILPFGSGENAPGGTFGAESPGEAGEEEMFDEFGQPITALFRLAVEPVAGAVAFNKSSTTAAVRYVDRVTGHIFEIILPGNNALGMLQKKKISNKTLPKIYEAYFRPDGNAVLLRSLKDGSDTVENLSLTLAASSTADGLYNVSATSLRGDMGSVIVGFGNTLYYSLRDSGSIVSSSFNSAALKTIFTSIFTDWRLGTVGNNILLTTKASSDASGYAYTLNQSSGSLSKILGPLNGLTVTADAAGTHIVYSYMESGLAKSSAKNLQSGAIMEILPVTLSEKCVWSTKNKGVVYCASPVDGIGANEPDNWHRGITHFSDRLWRFDTNGEIAQILSEPKTGLGLDLDVAEPKLSPNEDYLIFINRRDLSLWALKLEPF